MQSRSAGIEPANSGFAAPRWLVGLALSASIGYIGWKRQSLTGSGVVGAIVSGTVITGAGGYVQSALLVAFFSSSSALSRLPSTQATKSIDAIAQKDGRRDLWQAFANGGIPTALALGSDSSANGAVLGALSAVTGDTWATEIGARYGTCPRSITSLRPVATGESGGITAVGLLASVAGGLFISGVAVGARTLDRAFPRSIPVLAAIGAAAGILGSVVDSFVGATLQERRWCESCRRTTERTIHSCGQPTRIIGGIPGLTNDGVNVICSLTGGITGWTIARLLNR
jgi:uncharacterized protein (TIGR00297 family)